LIIENGLDFFQFSQVFSDLSFNAINIHVGTIQTFEHRVLVHMAMGHLVLSQVLQPDFGFLPNCEYVHFTNTVSLEDALSRIEKDPQWSSWVAERGRLMVEKHRASEVWERTHKSILQMNGERNGIKKIRDAR
jgi:glyoxylate carboligase